MRGGLERAHQRVSGTADLQGQCFLMHFNLQVQGVPEPLPLRVESTLETPAPASQRCRRLAGACIGGPPAPASQNLYFSECQIQPAYWNIPSLISTNYLRKIRLTLLIMILMPMTAFMVVFLTIQVTVTTSICFYTCRVVMFSNVKGPCNLHQ